MREPTRPVNSMGMDNIIKRTFNCFHFLFPCLFWLFYPFNLYPAYSALSDGQISAFVIDFESRLPKYLRNALHHENKAA